MTKHRLLSHGTWAVFLVMTLGLAGCASQPANTEACKLSNSSNVSRLFAEVQEKLDTASCHYSWPHYQERLIAAAKASPGPENEALFAQLLRDSIDSGIIGKRQGQELFSRYFDPEFYTVKAEARSSCSALRDKDALYVEMREELDYKREGMLEVLDDEARFRQAQQHYSDLRLVFDALAVACNEA